MKFYALSYTTRYSELRSFFFNKSVNSFPFIVLLSDLS